MRRILFLLAALAACGDNLKPSTPDDAGIDAAVDAPSGRLTGCIDRPNQLPVAPSGQLPCDLIPPGLAL